MRRIKPNLDLKRYYVLFLETGLILTFLLFIIASNINLASFNDTIYEPTERELTNIEEIPLTKQIEQPPAPPRPPVPVPVPDDHIIDDIDIDLFTFEDFDERYTPPPPQDEPEEDEEKVFELVEQMPELIGGLASIQKMITYPETARRAGIEGRVFVQFVVNERGEVENPVIIRGIGGGADEEALRAVKQAKFRPGLQRGRPVRVQYSLPVVFRLQN